MRKLFAFFRRFRIFLFFAGLQFLALSTYFSSLSFPKSQYLSSANQIGGTLWSVQNYFTRYFHLDETNSKLLEKNKALHEKMPESFIRLDEHLFSINDTVYEQQYSYITATVINSTYDKRNNYLTLNIGRDQGVEREMGVFSEDGVVGIVQSVSEHFCLVKSVLSKNINIDVMVQNGGAFGLLKWETQNVRTANISGISNDIGLKRWSKVVTRGGGGIFPRGIPVGKIKKVSLIEGKPLWDVEIKLGVNFKAIQKVYVVKNLLKKEQQELEAKAVQPPETDE